MDNEVRQEDVEVKVVQENHLDYGKAVDPR